MANSNFQSYKAAKELSGQVDYLKKNKNITFIEISALQAEEKLLRFNYINIITPYKHRFAKKDSKHNMIKVDGSHVYSDKVDFSEYYTLFRDEHEKCKTIISNILDFEIQFKSIVAYYILTSYTIENSNDLIFFLDKLKIRFSFLICAGYSEKRIYYMNKHIDSLKDDIFKYADIYCFFDRMNLGSMLTIFTCLENKTQDNILLSLKEYDLNFNISKVPDFISKIFCLVSIRNCVMHANSLEILVRFYNPKKHELRTSTDRKKYIKLINELSKEKTHD